MIASRSAKWDQFTSKSPPLAFPTGFHIPMRIRLRVLDATHRLDVRETFKELLFKVGEVVHCQPSEVSVGLNKQVTLYANAAPQPPLLPPPPPPGPATSPAHPAGACAGRPHLGSACFMA